MAAPNPWQPPALALVAPSAEQPPSTLRLVWTGLCLGAGGTVGYALARLVWGIAVVMLNDAMHWLG